MLYYFNVEDDVSTYEICLDLPDMAAVRREANLHARDLLNDQAISSSRCKNFVVLVTDESRVPVWRLEFSAASDWIIAERHAPLGRRPPGMLGGRGLL